MRSVHAYWLIQDNCAEQDWRDIQQRLIDHFGSDKSITNPSRLMRLPYFDHVAYDADQQTYSRQAVTIAHSDSTIRYTVEDMRNAFPQQRDVIALEADSVGAAIHSTSIDLSTWDALNAEARRRIRRLTPTPKLSGDGMWLHARGICHGGQGEKALYLNIESGAYGCFAGCDGATIFKSLGLPTKPQIDAENSTGSLITSWADFSERQFDEREKIISDLELAEVGTLFASTNVGKTTLSLNVSLILASGGKFTPLVDRKEGGRRVLYVDGESRRARLQGDIKRMLHDWDESERGLVDQNLYIACDAALGGMQLDLTKPPHLKWLSEEAKRVQPALIVIDTMASLFALDSENENSEVLRKVMRPLAKLATDSGAAVLLLHHIGKQSEDAQSGTKAYRGRGASAIGSAARVVLLLKQDPNNEDCVSLICAKAKGKKFSDVVLRLDQEARWFVNTNQAPMVEPSSYWRVVETVKSLGVEVKRSSIYAALEDGLSKSQIGKHLLSAVKNGDLITGKHGYYCSRENAHLLDAIDNEQMIKSNNGVPTLQDMHPEKCSFIYC